MNIEQLRNLDPKTISLVIRDHGSNTHGLSPDLADYLLQINRAAELMRSTDSDGSQLSVARLLQQDYPDLSLSTARRRVSDAVAYLYQQTGNTAEQWHEFYADKMDRLAQQAEQNGDLESARRCYQQAHDYRTLAAEGRVDPERIRHKRILVSPDVDASRMGLGSSGLRELYRQAADIISQAQIPQKEKERTLRDIELETGIEDINLD